MCTVTVIPMGANDFVLTTNRDEAPNRPTLKPAFYALNHTKLWFPKDELSGGTWIGVSDKKRVVCLLNGGFVGHERKSNYRLSRGVVVKDILISKNVIETVLNYNFLGIEPFTVILLDWSMGLKLYELVWDGLNTHFKPLDFEPKIWSSSSLYSKTMKSEREQWFEAYKKDTYLNPESLLRFHKTAGQNNGQFGVIMDRGHVKTTSITQVAKSGINLNLHHINLLDRTEIAQVFVMP